MDQDAFVQRPILNSKYLVFQLKARSHTDPPGDLFVA